MLVGVEPNGTAAAGSHPELVAVEQLHVSNVHLFGRSEDPLPLNLALVDARHPLEQIGATYGRRIECPL